MGDTEAPCRGSAGAKDQEAGRHLAVVREEQLASVAGAAARPQHSGPRGQRTGRRAVCLPRANARASPTGHRRPVKRLCVSLGRRRRLG